jgi:hypothetical protein
VAAAPIADGADVPNNAVALKIGIRKGRLGAPYLFGIRCRYPYGVRRRACHLCMRESQVFAQRKAPPKRGEFDP